MAENRPRYTLDQINKMTLLPYARTMALVFANASWVPVLAFPHRPFRDLEHLFECMTQVLKGSDESSKLQVIEQQPDLVNPPPDDCDVQEFQLFQCDLIYHKNLAPGEKTQMEVLQKQYHEKFGFALVFDPFQKSASEVIQQVTSRMNHTREEEFKEAIDAAASLAHTRLHELLIL